MLRTVVIVYVTRRVGRVAVPAGIVRRVSLQGQVSDNVRLFTAAQGTSPGAVALRLGKSRQWVQAKLAGRNRWSTDDVEAISDALGVSPMVLMSTDWWPDELRRARRDSNPQPSDLWRAAA